MGTRIPNIADKLVWFDEGDGYQHAHVGGEPCDDSIRSTEVASIMTLDLSTSIELTMSPMPADDAKQLSESLYRMAADYIALGRATGRLK